MNLKELWNLWIAKLRRRMDDGGLRTLTPWCLSHTRHSEHKVISCGVTEVQFMIMAFVSDVRNFFHVNQPGLWV